MSKIKKTLALLLAVLMTIGMMTMPAFAADEIDDGAFGSTVSGQPEWPNEGSINLTKAHATTGNDGEYEITLTIEGKNYKTTSDVVLVIDCSGSMEGTKLTHTRQAAKLFGEKLLNADDDTRIAIVTYVKEATAYNNGHFYTASELKAFEDAVDDATYANGGTNQQAGIHVARELLKSDKSTGQMKNIVILSDGEPTYSYKLTATATWINCYYDWRNIHRWGTGVYAQREEGQIDESTITVTGCDYRTIVGNGSSGNGGRMEVTATCQHNHTRGPETRTVNHDVATIWEANQAKAEGIAIFSVALQAGTNGEAVLEACATDPAKDYYPILNSDKNVEDKLKDSFQQIAGRIAIAASNGKVTDPMSDHVTMVVKSGAAITNDINVYKAGNADIYISQGTAAWNSETKTISWNVGNINENAPAVMKYKVTINDDVEKGQLVPTNKTTTFDYDNYLGEKTNSEFDIPHVNPLGGAITIHYYTVDHNGNPVNSNGDIADRPDLAYQIKERTFHAGPDDKTALDYGTYEIASETIEGFTYKGYTLDDVHDPTLTHENTAIVEVTTTNAHRDVWFAYVPQFKVGHVQGEKETTYTMHDYTENFDLTSVVSKGYLYGGAFDDEKCGENNVQTFANGKNATDFKPVPGKTYYIWEVSDKYLNPKSITLRETNSYGQVDAIGFYMAAAIDRAQYNSVGFDVKCGINIVSPIEIEKTWAADGDTTGLANGKIYESVNITLKSGAVDTYTVGKDTAFDVESGYLFCYDVPKSNWSAIGTEIVFTPYWITLDGVKVTALTRTCKYGGPANKSMNSYFVEKVGDVETKTAKYIGVITLNDSVRMLRTFAALNADPYAGNEPSIDEPSIDTNFSVKYFEQGWFKVNGLTLITAVDEGEYEEVGFIINGTKYTCDRLSSSYGICSPRILFGSSVSSSAKLGIYNLSCRGMSEGATITVTPYRVAADGSTTEGTTRELTYYSRGIEG